MDSPNSNTNPQPQETQEQQPASPLKMSLTDYLQAVVKWLRTSEGLSLTEVKGLMNQTWDPPLADGARTGRDELLMSYEEGLPPETAAQVLLL